MVNGTFGATAAFESPFVACGRLLVAKGAPIVVFFDYCPKAVARQGKVTVKLFQLVQQFVVNIRLGGSCVAFAFGTWLEKA